MGARQRLDARVVALISARAGGARGAPGWLVLYEGRAARASCSPSASAAHWFPAIHPRCCFAASVYGSRQALARSFRRELGMSPTDCWRKSQRAASSDVEANGSGHPEEDSPESE